MLHRLSWTSFLPLFIRNIHTSIINGLSNLKFLLLPSTDLNRKVVIARRNDEAIFHAFNDTIEIASSNEKLASQ